MLFKKMIPRFVLVLLFAPLIISCSKDKQTIIKNDWQVESIKVHADSALQYPAQGKIYTLSFENNLKKNYSFRIGSNTSTGKVAFESKNGIEFKAMFITLVMWDSIFSENIYDMLLKVNKYEMTGDALTLMNDSGGVINLKK